MTALPPVWLTWVQALAVPIISVAAVLITFLQFRLAKRKRADDLFDRRFKLLEDALNYRKLLIKVDSSEQILREWGEIEVRSQLLFDKQFSVQLLRILDMPSDEYETVAANPSLIELFQRRMT